MKGEEFVSVLDDTKLGKLALLYDGDKDRDASSKIRGYLFQDYVAIDCLLKEDVVYVCSEYLEDIDVVFEDGRFEIIQVKYYPKTSPDKKEIMTDLYYQFLRFQILQLGLDVKPSLYIHTGRRIEKPTIAKMIEIIEENTKLPQKVNLPIGTDPREWLETINTKKTKQEKKNTLFANMASENSLNDFVKKCHIEEISMDIKQYKEDLMNKLADVYLNTTVDKERKCWQLILFGLAISYIQQRYLSNDSRFEELRVNKNEFDQYMMRSVQTESNKTIVSYLVGIVCYEFGEIINNDNLSDLQVKMLNLIYKNTLQWIGSIAATEHGQYQLLNTISIDSLESVKGYKNAPINDRLLCMAECKPNFQLFLDYLWKIMLNVCQEKVKDEKGISEAKELFDPAHYIVSPEYDYICLHFPEDQYINRSVILPSVTGKPKRLRRVLVERIVRNSSRPEKWFFQNHWCMAGKNYYSYSTADVNENPTVADLGEDSFYIECMDCIGIDEDDWHVIENCNDCIFSLKCVKEGK